jgi:hypothetical protein
MVSGELTYKKSLIIKIMNTLLKYVQKLDIKSWLIIGLIIVVALLILFRPSGELPDSSGPYQEAINKLEVKNAIKDSTINDLKRRYADTVKTLSIKLASNDKELFRLKKKASNAEKAIPPHVIEDHPEVGTALMAKDSVIQKQDEQADVLKAAIKFQQIAYNDLSKAYVDKEAINRDMHVAKDKRLIEERRLHEKTFKQKTFWKKVGQTAVVIVIVETAILILQ